MNEGVQIFSIIVGGGLYIIWLIIAGVNQITENEFKRENQDSFIDAICRLIGLPAYTKKTYSGAECEIYTAWYVFILPILVITIIPIKFLYRNLIGSKIASFKKKQFQEKLLINITDIYSYKEDDKIRLKNGIIVIMKEFSPRGFSDAEKNIYSWNKAKINLTAEKRKEINTKNIDFEIFAKEAAEFKIKADEFKKQIEIQEQELLKQYEIERTR